MAIIEFKNTETEKAFLDASREDRNELQKMRRAIYLLRSGQWSPYWDGL